MIITGVKTVFMATKMKNINLYEDMEDKKHVYPVIWLEPKVLNECTSAISPFDIICSQYIKPSYNTHIL